jgi:class 3 adenylate cyclase
VERELGVAYVVDTSTNGTRLNGIRIERAVPVILESGDILTVGVLQLEFQSESLSKPDAPSPLHTTRRVTNADYVMVVGDIVDFSTSSHSTPSQLIMESLEVLLREFRELLTGHRGTLSNFVGDAFFAIWELGPDAEAPQLAVDFVVAAAARVTEVAPTLPFRCVDGEPLRMGWGLAQGDAAVSSLTGVLLGVVGDTTNLAFRLSGIAGRQGHSEVLVTDALYQQVAHRYPFEAPEYVDIKGWTEAEAVHGLRLPIAPESVRP